MPKKMIICKNKTPQENKMVFNGIGSSNKLRHEIMCVVNKKGLIKSNDFMSNIPIMVKMIMVAITVTIGVIELSMMVESIVPNDATTLKERKAIKNALPHLQLISSARIIVSPSLFMAIKSPTPKMARETNKAKIPNTRSNRKVYINPDNHLARTIFVRLAGVVSKNRIEPDAVSPLIKSPVTKATSKGI